MAYVYRPLSAANDIRLIRLLPGEKDDNICLELENTTLERAIETGFEAVSYVWGSTQNLQTVWVGGPNDTLLVTTNLYQLLQRFRYPDRCRILWADAICINQKDIPERGQQVQLMSSIYRKATKVLVWLGQASENSSQALDCLRQIGEHASYNWQTYNFDDFAVDFNWPERGAQAPFDESGFLAVHELFGRPWFSRLWVWQEIQLGKERAVLTCGGDAISWRAIRNAVAFLMIKPLGSSRAMSLLQTEANRPRLSAMWSMCEPEIMDLFTSLNASRTLKCSDDRDRVFAMLSTVSGETGIQPDYALDIVQLYKLVVTKYIEVYLSLAFVQWVVGPPAIKGLPSWAPDWTQPMSTIRIAGTRAGLRVGNLSVRQERKVLNVYGKIIGHIDGAAQYLCAKNFYGTIDTCAFSDALHRALPSQVTARIRQGDRFVTEQVCRVLCGNLFEETFRGTVRSRMPCLETAVAVLPQLLANTMQETSNSEVLVQLMQDMCENRSVVCTTKSGLGLAPAHALPGDKVAILPGCGTAVCLRPAPQNRYTVVGPMYYDRCMEGEALIGPLPQKYKSVQTLSPGPVQWMFGFENTETGETQTDDPRLDESFIMERTADMQPVYDLEKIMEQRGLELERLELV